MIEIFSTSIKASVDPEAEGVFKITGTHWEGEEFTLYIREEDAKWLLVVLGDLVYGE